MLCRSVIVLMLLQKSIRRLKLSAKDEKIKTESERTKADPSKLDAWMKQQASQHSHINDHFQHKSSKISTVSIRKYQQAS